MTEEQIIELIKNEAAKMGFDLSNCNTIAEIKQKVGSPHLDAVIAQLK